MISNNAEKILNFLLKNQEELGFNINQIAKQNKISVGSAFKILKELEKNEIMLSRKISNSTHFTINLENKLTKNLCEIILIKQAKNLGGYPKIYAEDIKKIEEAKIAILFGSILKKNEFKDVDVLIVTNNPKKVLEQCIEISKNKTKPVVPLIMNEQELVTLKEPIPSILKTGIVLKGETEFIEAIRNAKTNLVSSKRIQT